MIPDGTKVLPLWVAALAVLFATGCAQHQYVVERVKDVNGNDAFLRIDLTGGVTNAPSVTALESCERSKGFHLLKVTCCRSAVKARNSYGASDR
jgi:hypothetical protein